MEFTWSVSVFCLVFDCHSSWFQHPRKQHEELHTLYISNIGHDSEYFTIIKLILLLLCAKSEDTPIINNIQQPLWAHDQQLLQHLLFTMVVFLANRHFRNLEF